MPGLKGLGGGGIFCDQILFHRKSKFRRVFTYEYTCKYYVCGIKHATKVMRLHKIRVEKISLFHLKKRAVNYF